MEREQFLQLLSTKQYQLIAYQYHLENGKTRLTYENWIDTLNNLFYYMNRLCIDATFSFDDIIRIIIEKYFDKFNIVSLIDKNGKLIGYM